MRILITGVAGFVGRHLARHLQAEGDGDLWGVTRFVGERVPGVTPLVADLTIREQVVTAVRTARPDLVYHLAAQASVAVSFRDPVSTFKNNVVGQINLLEAIAEARLDPRILIVGSGEVYGLVKPHELPISERNELRPINPYAVSKAAQDLVGFQYFASHRLKIIRVRPFGQIGPGQSDDFVAPAFARQIAEIEAGLREPVISVGYLHGQRDFTDVRDVVRGYRLALVRGTPGEVYNLGSGTPRPIQSLLEGLMDRARVRPAVVTDPSKLRPVEVPVMYCDCAKLRDATGWRPEIPFEQSLADVLDDWRARVRESAQRPDHSATG